MIAREHEMTRLHLLRVAATAIVGLFSGVVVADPGGAPPGWGTVGWPQQFDLRLDPAGGRGGSACVRIRGIAPDEGKWAGVGQNVEAAPWRGQRLHLSAWLRSLDVEDWGGLYLRVDGQDGKPLAFANSRLDPVRGTTDWHRYEVTVAVPPEAAGVAFGVHLNGRGILWADDFSLDSAEGR